MTEEFRQRANRVHKEIEDLTSMLNIVESFLHTTDELWVSDHTNGEIKVSETTRLDIIDLLLKDIEGQKEAKEDEFRML